MNIVHESEREISQSKDHNQHLVAESLDDLPLITESMVQLTVQPEDNGHQIVCQAWNDQLPKSVPLEGMLLLNVTCK